MLGSVDIRIRPIRLAYLIEPGNEEQVREAIRLSSSLWAGTYFPIIPLYQRMPATWKGPLKVPAAGSVVLGYIEAFDPDILVQCSSSTPSYITETGLRIIRPSDIWQSLEQQGYFSPKFGLGIFELLGDVFEEHFKYKTKYPVKV